MAKDTSGLNRGGRKPGAKDRQKRAPSAAVNAHLAQVRPDVETAEGRTSRVVRTHAEARALAWWAGLTPLQRAERVEWLYQQGDNPGFLRVTGSISENDWAD